MITLKTQAPPELLARLPRRTGRTAGGQWSGVSHGELLQELSRVAAAHGVLLDRPAFALGAGGDSFAASFVCEVPGCTPPAGTSFALGVTTNNAGREATFAYAGLVLDEDGTGVPLAELLGGRKHTSHATAAALADDVVGGFVLECREAENHVEVLRKSKMSERRLKDVLFEAGEDGILPWSHIGDLLKEIQTRPEVPLNGWSLLVHFARVARKSPPLLQMRRVFRFRELLPSW